MIHLTEDKKENLKKLYVSGLSQEATAKIIGCDRTAVGYWARRFGIQRSLSESHIGQHSSPSTEFKNGMVSWNSGITLPFQVWNKGKKTGIVPSSAFKNGHPAPTTAFKKGQASPNKGKPAPWARGENNVNWRGGVSDVNRSIRSSDKYKQWRSTVFKRDDFLCQNCKNVKYKGIVAHHIKEFSEFPELRFEVSNGLTLCRACHCFHHNPRKGK